MSRAKHTLTVGDHARRLVEWITNCLYEKEQIGAMALLCAIAGENIFLLGPPGTAKSLVARRLKGVFSDAHVFEYLMSRFSTPDEIFGPISISRLKESDSYERLTTGFLPEAEVVFLDEIWKAGPSIQNTLLTAINEHIYYNGTRRMSLPMKVLIAAGNELPPKNEGLEALWDRFLVRMVSNSIADDDNFERMLTTPVASDRRAGDDIAITPGLYADWQCRATGIEVGKPVFVALKSMRHALSRLAEGADGKINPDYYISDRRWKKIFGLLKTSAFLNGRAAVDCSDLVILIHCLWNTPECRSDVNRIVAESLWSDITRDTAAIDLSLRSLVMPDENSRSNDNPAQFVAETEYTVFYNSYYGIENFNGAATTLIPSWDYKKLSYMETMPGTVTVDHSLRMPVVQIENRNSAFSLASNSGKPRKVKLQKCNGGVMIDDVPYSLTRRGGQLKPQALPSARAAEIDRLATRLDRLSQEWNRSKPELLKAMKANIFISSTDIAMVSAAMEEVDRSIAGTRIKVGNVQLILS